ncbi:MAG: tetratricopeptide repeat protein [Methanolinea sp.]|nr:tetratricopeptide repeat protein [Methanolinea sp.]
MTTGGRAIAMAVPIDEIDTPYPEARDLLTEGLTYNAMGGRYLEALECFDRTLAIDPDFAIAWQAKGVALHNLGRYEEAIECYDRAFALDPGNEGVETLKNLAVEDRVRAGR